MTNPSAELFEERRGAVLWLTISREARRNAISPSVLSGLYDAIERVQHEREVRAVVLTGAGNKAFCAGADLATGTAFRFDHSQPYAELANLLRLARRSIVPLVARVNGACMAGGIGLLAMCDLAVAAPHAVFGLPEVKVGLFPAQVLSVLYHLLPRRALAQMCLTGEPISAEQALNWGLVNAVADDLDAGLQSLLSRLLDKSPAAIRRGLYTMKAIEAMSFEESVRFTESQIALFALTEDAAEGQLAFREKRAPNWTGR
jgi:enoyl-CoA hydratase/carnithine racemase